MKLSIYFLQVVTYIICHYFDVCKKKGGDDEDEEEDDIDLTKQGNAAI